MGNYKIAVFTFVICFVFYFLPELFFSDTMLYLIGGIFGGILNEILSFFIENPNNNLIDILWGLLLIIIIIFAIRTKIFFIKYFLIILICLLLYIVDLQLYKIVSYDADIENRLILNSSFKSTLFKVTIAIIKSLILSNVYLKATKKG